MEGVVTFQDGSNSSLRFDLFELDFDLGSKNSQLRRSGVAVDLPPQALKVLCQLTARPNKLITRQEIKDALWPGELHGDFDSRLNFTIKKLREALGDSAEQPRYVQTVRNAGYMFIAPVWATRGGPSACDDHLTSKTGGTAPIPFGSSVAEGSLPRYGLRLGLSALLIAIIAVAASAVAFGGFVLAPHDARLSVISQPDSTRGDGVPRIFSVSAIVPLSRQKIVIRGRGFGLHVPFSRTDSPHLAVRDKTHDWAAGRIIAQNTDEVMVDVERWTDDEIVISGFSGDYGKKGWTFVEGDRVEIAVWNPQSGAGPATFGAAVVSGGAR